MIQPVGGLTTSVILARGSELPQVPLQEVIFGGRWGKEDRLDNCKSDSSGPVTDSGGCIKSDDDVC